MVPAFFISNQSLLSNGSLFNTFLKISCKFHVFRFKFKFFVIFRFSNGTPRDPLSGIKNTLFHMHIDVEHVQSTSNAFELLFGSI